MIWYLPLERIDMRYTALMDDDLVREFRVRRLQVQRVYPTVRGMTNVPAGQFLDWPKTTEFKALQVARLAATFAAGEVHDGDVVFCSDLWFPGIEAVLYMAQLSGIKVKLAGVLHAGTWSPTDDVATKLGRWALRFEEALIEAADLVLVGTEFHKQEIAYAMARVACSEKIKVTGLCFPMAPIVAALSRCDGEPRAKRVVCTGRPHPEKRHDLFERLAACMPDYEFVLTHELALSKRAYFDLLATSEVVFSAAEQENYGYGVLEAVALGCRPVVPDALAYQDLYPAECRYQPGDMAHAARLVRASVGRPSYIECAESHFDNTARMIDQLETLL